MEYYLTGSDASHLRALARVIVAALNSGGALLNIIFNRAAPTTHIQLLSDVLQFIWCSRRLEFLKQDEPALQGDSHPIVWELTQNILSLNILPLSLLDVASMEFGSSHSGSADANMDHALWWKRLRQVEPNCLRDDLLVKMQPNVLTETPRSCGGIASPEGARLTYKCPLAGLMTPELLANYLQHYMTPSWLNAAPSQLVIGIHDEQNQEIGISLPDFQWADWLDVPIGPQIFPTPPRSCFAFEQEHLIGTSPSDWGNEPIFVARNQSRNKANDILIRFGGRASVLDTHPKEPDPANPNSYGNEECCDVFLPESGWRTLQDRTWSLLSGDDLQNALHISRRFLLRIVFNSSTHHGATIPLAFFQIDRSRGTTTKPVLSVSPLVFSGSHSMEIQSMDACTVWLRARMSAPFAAPVREALLSGIFNLHLIFLDELPKEICHSSISYFLGDSQFRFHSTFYQRITQAQADILLLQRSRSVFVVPIFSVTQGAPPPLPATDCAEFVIILVPPRLLESRSSVKSCVRSILNLGYVLLDVRMALYDSSCEDPVPPRTSPAPYELLRVVSNQNQVNSFRTPSSAALSSPIALDVSNFFDLVQTDTDWISSRPFGSFVRATDLENSYKSFLEGRETRPAPWALFYQHITPTKQAKRIAYELLAYFAVPTDSVEMPPRRVKVVLSKLHPGSGATTATRSICKILHAQNALVLWVKDFVKEPSIDGLEGSKVQFDQACQRAVGRAPKKPPFVVVVSDEIRSVHPAIDHALANSLQHVPLLWIEVTDAENSDSASSVLLSPYLTPMDIHHLHLSLVSAFPEKREILDAIVFQDDDTDPWNHHIATLVLAATAGLSKPMRSWVRSLYHDISKDANCLEAAIALSLLTAYSAPKSAHRFLPYDFVFPSSSVGHRAPSPPSSYAALRSIFVPTPIADVTGKPQVGCVHHLVARLILQEYNEGFHWNDDGEHACFHTLSEVWTSVAKLLQYKKLSFVLTNLITDRFDGHQFSPFVEALLASQNPSVQSVDNIVQLIETLEEELLGFQKNLLFSKIAQQVAQYASGPDQATLKANAVAWAKRAANFPSIRGNEQRLASRNFAFQLANRGGLNDLENASDLSWRLYEDPDCSAPEKEDIIGMVREHVYDRLSPDSSSRAKWTPLISLRPTTTSSKPLPSLPKIDPRQPGGEIKSPSRMRRATGTKSQSRRG